MEPINKANYQCNKKPLTEDAGFSLVELMVVVVIIGVLVAIAVPVYQNMTQSAAEKTDEANRRIIKSAVMAYIASEGIPEGNGAPEGGWEDALVGEHLIEWPKPPEELFPGKKYIVVESFADYEVELADDN